MRPTLAASFLHAQHLVSTSKVMHKKYSLYMYVYRRDCSLELKGSERSNLTQKNIKTWRISNWPGNHLIIV